MKDYKEITIEWSYPIEMKRILQTEAMQDIGLYQISRVWGGKETLLYIGKTTYSFGSRLKVHLTDRIAEKRGTKYVRLGRIVQPANLSPYEMDGYINDAEKTLIFYLENEQKYILPVNVISKYNTNPKEDLIINNIGYRGILKKRLFIPEKYDI